MPAEGAYLTGRHAVVTGGGRGIGAAIAEELARLGATLTLMGRDAARLEAHARDVASRNGARVESVACDVADDASVAEALAVARVRYGDVQVVV